MIAFDTDVLIEVLLGDATYAARAAAIPRSFSDEQAVFAELCDICDIVEEVIAVYKQEGKPLPPPHSWQAVATRG